MANRYWVGGGSSANWNAVGPTNWGSASGVQDNASVPGTADDVFLDGVGTGASNGIISAAITIKSLDCTGYANTLTHNAFKLTISGLTGVLTMSAGMTYTLANGLTSEIEFTATSGIVSLTSAGKTFGNLTKSGAGGKVTFQDAITMANLTLTGGTIDTNGQDWTAISFTTTNTAARTLIFSSGNAYITGNARTVWGGVISSQTYVGGGTINLTYAGATGTRTIGQNYGNTEATSFHLKVTAGTDIIAAGGNAGAIDIDFTGFAGSFSGSIPSYGSLTLATGMTTTGNFTFNATTAGKTITMNGNTAGSFTFNGIGGAWTLQDALTLTGTLSMSAGTFDANGIDLTLGNLSIQNNANVKVLTLTNRTITITGSGSLLAFTGSGTTFNVSGTTLIFSYAGAASRVLQGGSVFPNWPLMKITAGTGQFDIGEGGNTALNVTDFDCTGFTGNLRWNTGSSGALAFLGDVTFGAGMTTTMVNVNLLNFRKSLTPNGVTLNIGVRQMNLGGTSGVTFNLYGDLVIGGTGATQFQAATIGGLNLNGYALTAPLVTYVANSTWTVDITNSLITLTGTGTVWGFGTPTSLTFIGTGSTIKITDASAVSKTFAGGGKTYGTVEWAKGAGTSMDDITGNNTFGVLKNSGTAPFTIRFAASTTTTLLSAAGWLLNGSASGSFDINLISATAGTWWTISVPSGIVSASNVWIKDSAATGGATFNADASLSVKNNTGWNFTNPHPQPPMRVFGARQSAKRASFY